jgi:cobalt/nickel transport system permease protein
MHLFDGFLSLPVIAVTFAVTLIFWIISFKKAKGSLDEKQVPLMGLLTALFFAANSINIPVLGGFTAHILGGAALGIILGPFAGCISMTIILVLQAFLFGDGGLTALGANVLNMGIIAVFVPAVMLLIFNKATKGKGLLTWVLISTLVGDIAAGIFAGVELGFSQPTIQILVTPLLVINQTIIGIIEGGVTVAIIAVLIKVRPDVLTKSPSLKFLQKIKTGGTNNE